MNCSYKNISGKKFNKKFPNTLFYILINENYHDEDGLVYFVGLNVLYNVSSDYLTFPFYASYDLVSKLDHSIKHMVAHVDIPDDAIVTVEYPSLLTYSDKLLVHKPVHKNSFEIIGDNYSLNAVENNPYCLKYVKNKTPKICKIAIESDPNLLQYVDVQTEKMCLMAVSRDYRAIKYVKKPTIKICAAAIEGVNSRIDNVAKRAEAVLNRFNKERGECMYLISSYKDQIKVIHSMIDNISSVDENN